MLRIGAHSRRADFVNGTGQRMFFRFRSWLAFPGRATAGARIGSRAVRIGIRRTRSAGKANGPASSHALHRLAARLPKPFFRCLLEMREEFPVVIAVGEM